MRNLLFVFALIFSSLLSAQPAFRGCHHSEHKRSQRPLSAAEHAMLKALMERSDTIDVLDYDITLEIIDYTNRWIKGNCAVKFTPNMNNVALLPLDLLTMQIDSIVGASGLLTYSYDSLYLGINLPSAMNMGDTATIRVYYQGSPTPDPAWGGFKFDGQYAYSMGIGLNSNPYNMGRSWFPCFDNFVERATVGINVYTKLPRRAYAIGTFLGESVVAGDTILRQYRMNQPVTTYITNVAVSDYAQVDYTHNAMAGPLPFQLVAHSGDTSSMRGTFVQLGDAVDAMEHWWGPYWWERVGYIATPQGAMEHPTNITYPVSSATGGNTASHKKLMTHELGHCWWGDVVTLKGPFDMWIKEGNAEYSAHLFTEFTENRASFINEVKSNFKDVLRSAHYDDNGFQPLSGIPYEHTYGTHTYYKGAAMLHNMRAYLGDSLFRVGQQSVINTYQYSAIDAAMYRDQLTAATGVDMTSFFNDWIYAPGYAAFEVNEIRAIPSGNNFALSIQMEQKRRAAPHFYTNVPIELTLIDANWNKTIVHGMLSGQYDTIQTTLPFVPVAWLVNESNMLNMAQLHNEISVTVPITTTSIPFVDAVLAVPAVSDSFRFSMDHYWVAPDSIINNPNQARISSTHYWKVDGTFSQITGTLRFEYNAFTIPAFDADLVSHTEDSLILVYRQGPGFDWKKYPYYTKINLFNPADGNGFIRLDTILKGEYAFANGELPDWVAGNEVLPRKAQQLSLYPNPTAGVFTIDATLADAENILQIELFDLQGRLVYEERNVRLGQSFQHQVALTNVPAGVYWLKLSDQRGVLIESQAIGITP